MKMDKKELKDKIMKWLESDREDCERGNIYDIGDMTDDVLVYVDLYIEDNFDLKGGLHK